MLLSVEICQIWKQLKKQSLSETFSIYMDKRMIKILLLGAISGFPWVLIGLYFKADITYSSIILQIYK